MPVASDPLLQVDQVSLCLGHRNLLQQINLALYPKQIVSLIGPNGAGKTSLIKIIVGLIKPTAGRVIHQNLKIGYMPQRLSIDPFFPISVKRFLQLGKPVLPSVLEKVLLQVGVSSILDQPFYAISGGERQRVLLARALLQRPSLLVLDEPAQGVDLLGQGHFYNLIAHIRDQTGCAVLLVSHDLSVVMAKTDVVVCLNQHICCSGSPDSVSRDPAFGALFGSAADSLALYTHHHDHCHDIRGEIMHQVDK